MNEQAAGSDQWAPWRGRIDNARKRRDEKVGDWQENVQKRKGDSRQSSTISSLVSTSASTVSVNKDWPLTKAKIALLYSQTPEIRLATEDPRAAQVVPKFAKDLNSTIRVANVGAAIEEELADVINAAGISGVIVACEKRMEPRVDPVTQMEVQVPADVRYPVRHISAAC